MASFCYKDLGLALAAMTVRRFRRNKLFFFSLFFSEQAGSKYSNARLYKKKTFRAKKRTSHCVGEISSHFKTPKVDPILNLSNYQAITQITRVFRTNIQMSTQFFRDRSWLFARVMSPC